MTIQLRSDFDVNVMEQLGSDEFICKAARVSTQGAASMTSEESEGLIKFLMKNRHGTPFEHGTITFYVNAPIFVWREFMRHRIGISYNEQSGRYMELSPVFYIPNHERNLIQVGKAGAYAFVPGSNEQYDDMYRSLYSSYEFAWDAYQGQLSIGIAKEVARMCLPVSIYSAAYVTMNPRSIMHFLSLRTKRDGTIFPSFPMWEINEVANQIEYFFSKQFPITFDSFDQFGRVCP